MALAASIPLSLSFCLLPSPLPPQDNFLSSSSSYCARIFGSNSRVLGCAFASPVVSSSSSVGVTHRRRHWKQGESTGISGAVPRPPDQRKDKRTPASLHNVKKKKDNDLDRKNAATVFWANTVTEALSERIHNKQWLQALQVSFLSSILSCSLKIKEGK